jgi:hypothetical protein
MFIPKNSKGKTKIIEQNYQNNFVPISDLFFFISNKKNLESKIQSGQWKKKKIKEKPNCFRNALYILVS